jgi:hypothetical protein
MPPKQTTTVALQPLTPPEMRALESAGRDPSQFVAVVSSAVRVDVTQGPGALYVGAPEVEADDVELTFSIRLPKKALPALSASTARGPLRNVISARLLRSAFGGQRPLVRMIVEASALGMEQAVDRALHSRPVPVSERPQLTGGDTMEDLLNGRNNVIDIDPDVD